VQPTFATGDLQWPVPNAPGQGLPNPQQYDTSTPGVVVDKVTGLTWQQLVSTSTYTQAQAQAYCSGLGNGWRLPTIIELVSIVDVTQFLPSIDKAAFPDTPAIGFWSSTPLSGNPAYGWFVVFDDGVTANGDAMSTSLNGVRCVR
jgi:hypothetical protein